MDSEDFHSLLSMAYLEYKVNNLNDALNWIEKAIQKGAGIENLDKDPDFNKLQVLQGWKELKLKYFSR